MEDQALNSPFHLLYETKSHIKFETAQFCVYFVSTDVPLLNNLGPNI